MKQFVVVQTGRNIQAFVVAASSQDAARKFVREYGIVSFSGDVVKVSEIGQPRAYLMTATYDVREVEHSDAQPTQRSS